MRLRQSKMRSDVAHCAEAAPASEGCSCRDAGYWSWKDMWRHREQDVRTVRNEARCPTNGTLHGRDCGYHDEAFCKIPQSPSWS